MSEGGREGGAELERMGGCGFCEVLGGRGLRASTIDRLERCGEDGGLSIEKARSFGMKRPTGLIEGRCIYSTLNDFYQITPYHYSNKLSSFDTGLPQHYIHQLPYPGLKSTPPYPIHSLYAFPSPPRRSSYSTPRRIRKSPLSIASISRRPSSYSSQCRPSITLLSAFFFARSALTYLSPA